MYGIVFITGVAEFFLDFPELTKLKLEVEHRVNVAVYAALDRSGYEAHLNEKISLCSLG